MWGSLRLAPTNVIRHYCVTIQALGLRQSEDWQFPDKWFKYMYRILHLYCISCSVVLVNYN